MCARTRINSRLKRIPLTGKLSTALWVVAPRSEEHTSELQSHLNLVCRLLLEKKKYTIDHQTQANRYSSVLQASRAATGRVGSPGLYEDVAPATAERRRRSWASIRAIPAPYINTIQ